MSQNQAAWHPEVKNWFSQLDYALKREKDFRKEGRRVTKIYEGEKKENFQFNILYSNTETLSPALYNNVPRPVVDRRYKDKDPTGRAVSMTTKRLLEFLIDSNDQDYSNFDDMMKSAVVEALVPGRGLTRFKYEPKYGEEIAAEPAEGEKEKPAAEEEPLREVEAEIVCGEEVPWDRVRMGYAKKWKDVPWMAFEHFMDKDEATKYFGAEKAGQIPYPVSGGSEDNDDEEEGNSKMKDAEGEKLAHVYEIWDKKTKKVIFLAAGWGEKLKEVDDPLELSGFFPCPRPLSFMTKISTLTPTALYTMYEEQAKELNTCTVRINKLMAALKVRGFYDATLSGLKELFEQPDNTLLPAENVSAMLQGQTLDKAVWFFPIEKLVGVLQQLYMQRQQCKDVIYEITGISDILRGASVASETATAQNIKNQWGTLRLKKMQKEVMRYVRDSLRIMAEIAATKLSQETIAAMTGLEFPTKEQKQIAQMAIQKASQSAAMAGQPAPPPPPQVQKFLSAPSWDDVMKLLRDDLQRNYRIDIETNSTVDAEATEDKADVAEFMNAMAQFMNGMMPVIEQGIMSFDVAKGILLAIVKRFRFGVEVEDQINEMQGPPPKGPGEEDPKIAAEKAKVAAETEVGKVQMQAQVQKVNAETELGKLEMQNRANKMNAEVELGKLEMKMKQEALIEQRAYDALQHQMKMEELEMKREEIAARKAAALAVKAEAEKKGMEDATV